jgi:hypothetical protein
MLHVSRYRRPGVAVLALTFSLIFVFASTLVVSANESLVRISSDPYKNPDSLHKTEVEPDSFAFSNTVVSAFQVGRFFDGGASNIGWATSTDGGGTWTHGFLPYTTVNATPPGPYARASDSSVAYDAMHKVWLISYLGLKAPVPSVVDVLVSRSTDGVHWGKPIAVAANGQFYDKNWTVCDNTPSSKFFGNCYTEFDNASANDLEQMSTSHDGGLTWGAAMPTSDMSHGLGGQPVVQPNGTVIVPYMGLDSPFFAFTISSFMSTDGGASWSASTLISEGDFHHPNGNIRASFPIPDAEIDQSGKVYVVWSDCRFEASCAYSDDVLSTSTNGTTWSPVKRIPINSVGSNVDHFINGLAVDSKSSGHIGLTYYYYPNANCTTSTCQLDVGFISSTNGGASWSQAEQLAGPMKVPWAPLTTQGYMVGDYISTSIVPGDDDAVPVFAVAHQPTGGSSCDITIPGVKCDVAIYTTPESVLPIVGGSNTAGNDRVFPVTRQSSHGLPTDY